MSDIESDFDEDIQALQQELIKYAMEYKKQEQLRMEKILAEIKAYIRTLHDFPYIVEGDRAVSAWLNPSNKGLSKEELDLVKTVDWDISVVGDKEDARYLARKMHRELEEILGFELKLRDDDTLRMMFRDGVIYQIGIQDDRKIEWMIDIHSGEYSLDQSVMIDGIRYPKLKFLIDSIDQALQENKMKMVKRLTRRNLLEKALTDMSRFNPVFFNTFICEACIHDGHENITGYDLDCKDILPFCSKIQRLEAEKRREKLRD